MPKKAVIYARFSCNRQREASIEDQLRVCREWCAREGYAIVGEYSDYAMSGRSDDRPQFQKMIANAGESDIVLVYMMDRFSRDEYDAPAYKHELRKKGVEVVSAMEAMPDGPERIAEYYAVAPSIVAGVEYCDDAPARYAEIRSRWLGPCYAALQRGEMERCYDTYRDMVQTLQERYGV